MNKTDIDTLVDETVKDLQNLDWTDGDNLFNLNDYAKALAGDEEIDVDKAVEIVDAALNIVALEEVDEIVDEKSPCVDDVDKDS